MGSNFQLNDEGTSGIKQKKATANSGFARKLIGWGIAKNETQANMYLVVLVVICIGIIVFNVTRLNSSPAASVDTAVVE